MNQTSTTVRQTKTVTNQSNKNRSMKSKQSNPQAMRPPGQGKSRNARRRRKVVEPVMKTAGASNTLLKSLMHEYDLECSTSQQLQTLLNPTVGVYRPYSVGNDLTAIIGWRGSANITTLTATNNVLSFAFVPAYGGDSSSNYLFNWIPGTGVLTPNTAGGITGPFSINYATGYRYIGAELSITPMGANQNQAGAGRVAYYPNYTQTTLMTAGQIDQAAIGMPWEGTDQITCHCIPTANERNFSTSGTSSSLNSAILGYINVPTQSAAQQAWRIDVAVFYEYLPTTTYLPIAVRDFSTCHPDAQHFVNKFLNSTDGRPWLVAKTSDYVASVTGLVVHSGGHDAFSMAPAMGLYNQGGDIMDPEANVEQTLNDMKEQAGLDHVSNGFDVIKAIPDLASAAGTLISTVAPQIGMPLSALGQASSLLGAGKPSVASRRY